MALTSSGPLSITDIYTEVTLGNSPGPNVSLASIYAGDYTKINRNTTIGDNINSVNIGGTNFNFVNFYDYDAYSNIFWSYNITNRRAGDDIRVILSITDTSLTTTSIYRNIINPGVSDVLSNVDTGVFDSLNLVDINLTVNNVTTPNTGTVDIDIRDMDGNLLSQQTGVALNYSATQISPPPEVTGFNSALSFTVNLTIN